MIHHIKGKITHKEISYVVVENNGLGYFINIPLSTYDKLVNINEEVVLFIHPIIREDDISLYGFLSHEERQIFNLVIGVSGIGAKLGIAVLSALPIDSFVDAILSADIKLLSKISGVGKKTAERLVLDLKDKLNKLSFQASLSSSTQVESRAMKDAYLALQTLGFRIDLVRKVVQEAYEELGKEKATSEIIIKYALQELNK